ncbi:MAG: rhodanese-like domain-containing protein [Minisyncoccia bacterium]
MKQILVSSFKEIIDAEKNNPLVDFINVCTPAEYKEKHISGVRSVPLDEIEQHIQEFKDKKTIYVHCRSGRRGVAAIEKLAALGVKAELVNVEGGILAWEEAGYGTARISSRLSLMRQTFIAAGALVILAHALAFFIAPEWLALSAAVGVGLFLAGLTGWCGMTMLLARMPWNRD